MLAFMLTLGNILRRQIRHGIDISNLRPLWISERGRAELYPLATALHLKTAFKGEFTAGSSMSRPLQKYSLAIVWVNKELPALMQTVFRVKPIKRLKPRIKIGTET
jgi:hypothetical protein